MVGDILNALQSHGKTFKRAGAGHLAQCPAHPDNNPSLKVDVDGSGKVLLSCYAGCDLDSILRALDLDRSAVRPENLDGDGWTPFGRPIDIYRYTNEQGELLFEVLRCEGKNFPQRRPDKTTKSGWNWKLGDIRRPLYRLPRVLKGVEEGKTIFVVEGEKDVQALERCGEIATCNPGGAGKWRREHTEALRDADVAVVADRDDVGRKHAREVTEALSGVARAVWRVEPIEGKDTFDHLAAGHSPDDLVPVTEDDEPLDLSPDLLEFLASTDTYNWLVKGLFERGDRLILTGPEGHGKSQLSWQIAVCVAAGLHPFLFGEIEPRRVLLIECENGVRHTRRRLRLLSDRATAAGHPVAPGVMRVLARPQGLDLTDADDAAWLHERVVAHKPELVVLGPLYRLHDKDPDDAMAARAVQKAIDAVRSINECVVVLEAHSGHGRIDGKRNLRPAGSSVWLRWSEFGYGLDPERDGTYGFKAWRGPRDERAFPDEVHRGQVWPWEGKYNRKPDEAMF